MTDLDTVPGIGTAAAQVIIAETGGEMAHFETAAHLASWIGVCPGMNESAAVTKSARTRQGNATSNAFSAWPPWPRSGRRTATSSAFYRRIAARRGRQRAQAAVMRKIAVATWHILKHKTRYQELGADYLARQDPERAMRPMTKVANRLGLTVRFEPAGTA